MRFKKGQSGNPAGRPRGARNKLSEQFIAALAEDFASHGAEVIARVRTERPDQYLRVIAAILPKEVVEFDDYRTIHELSDDELRTIAFGGLKRPAQEKRALPAELSR